MPAPALKIPVSVDLQKFQQDMDKARQTTASGVRQIAQQFLNLNKSIQENGASAEVLSSTLLRSAGRYALIAGGVGVVIGTFKLMNAITDLAKEKMEEYIKIAEGAGAGGVSSDFFQRIVQSAKEAKQSTEAAAEALKRFKSETEDKLGGSPFGNRLTELQGAGNFQNNSGVDALKQATDAEARWRAMVTLITEAMSRGERLAALDLAARFLPPEMLERLRASGDYLQQMQQRADKLAASKLISDEDVGRAVDLKKRLDEAHETLANKFKPIQKDLISLGLNYHENWVGVVQQLASAVEKAGQLYNALKGIPGIFAAMGNAGWIKDLNDWMEKRGWNATPESMGLTVGDPGGVGSPEMIAARKSLADRLKNPAVVQEGMRQSTDIATGVFGDRSKNPVKEDGQARMDFVERYIESLQKANEVQQAELDTIGLSNVERAKAVALAQALSAARKEGRDLLDQERAKILAEAAANAVLGEKLRVVAQLQQAVRELGQSASHAFQEWAFEGKKAGEVTAALLKQLRGRGIDAVFNSIFGGSDGKGGLAGFFGNLFKAEGGPVSANRPYIVGERGPELFMPKSAGVIVPNQVIRSGGGSSGPTTINHTVKVDVSGARGSREIEDAVARGVARSAQMLKAYDRQLPGRIGEMQMTGV